MKIYRVSFFVLTLCLLFAGLCSCSEDKLVEQKQISIMQLMSNPGIDAIRLGFMQEMKNLGYVEGENVKYSQYNSQGDNSVAQTMAKKIIYEKPNLIFAITTPTAQTCANEIKGSGIPLVFGAVTDPVSSGLVDSLNSPGGNITGTSDRWPVSAQFDLLLKVVPNVKRVGVIYNPGESNSEENIKVVKEVCVSKKIELVTVAVSNTSEVYSAARSLVGRCDALYVPADNTVITAMDSVVKVSEQYKIPLLPGVSSNIEQGGFGTLGPDYFDIGVESARLADRILKGEKPALIPVSTAKKFEYFFNTRSAKATNVVIPEILLQKAVKVF